MAYLEQSLYFGTGRLDEHLDECWTKAVDTAVVDVTEVTSV